MSALQICALIYALIGFVLAVHWATLIGFRESVDGASGECGRAAAVIFASIALAMSIASWPLWLALRAEPNQRG